MPEGTQDQSKDRASNILPENGVLLCYFFLPEFIFVATNNHFFELSWRKPDNADCTWCHFKEALWWKLLLVLSMSRENAQMPKYTSQLCMTVITKNPIRAKLTYKSCIACVKKGIHPLGSMPFCVIDANLEVSRSTMHLQWQGWKQNLSSSTWVLCSIKYVWMPDNFAFHYIQKWLSLLSKITLSN